MGSFDGKVVIVTGGAKGIGRGIVHGFAAEGADVAVADVDGPASATLARELAAQGRRVHAVVADVSKAADAQRIVAEAVAAFGGVDVLVNNAGIQPLRSYLNVVDLPEEDWDLIVGVNLKSQYLLSKYAIPEMRKRGGGVVINIASVQGLQSMPRVPAYAASKGGSLSLTRNMALDFARENIRVVAICPGTIDSDMVRTAARAEGG
ncbi:MAG: SDR family oxidoreductase, partial [Actinobacteria bacterium]|nr:SDR family oxidoreductase [Actinomycetota bacterium]